MTDRKLMDSALEEAEKRLERAYGRGPISDEELFAIVKMIDPSAVRLPRGVKELAVVLEAKYADSTKQSVVAALRAGCNVNYEAADTIEELQRKGALRDNVMGRIAIALFGEQNNRTDEDCVAETEKLRSDLAAARALLKEAHGWLDPWESRQSALRDRIDAAIAEEKK